MYGYFQMTAELPTGAGLWPAFWLEPVNGASACEIDVFEAPFNNPSLVQSSLHDGGTGYTTGQVTVPDYSTNYNTYGVNWSPTTITYYVNGQETGSTPTPASCNTPAYILANLAVGGQSWSWPGTPNSSNTWPASMVIQNITYNPNGPNGVGNDGGMYSGGLAGGGATSATAAATAATATPTANPATLPASGALSGTARGTVVEFTDYSNSLGTGSGGSQGNIYTGSLLTNESAWFASMAAYYINNPYVWFGTNDEPALICGQQHAVATGPGILSAWQAATYAAIRGTGNKNPILLEPGGDVVGTFRGGEGVPMMAFQDPTVVATMTNVIWDPQSMDTWTIRDGCGD